MGKSFKTMLETSMRIATWNVNSLRIRLPHVTRWLDEYQPDILLLQETKVEDAQFPHAPFTERGYTAAIHGQKSYNGVAILSRLPLSEVTTGLPDTPEPDQCRLIAATVTPAGNPLRVISAYIPNGGDLGSEKFAYKRAYYQRLQQYLKANHASHDRLVIGGDLNISADERDVDNPARRATDVLFTPEERQWLAELRTSTGLADAFRLTSDESRVFSWWDYRNLAFQKNQGMRIDYLFVSPSLAGHVASVEHVRAERKQPQPSDHIPVVLTLGGL